MNLWELSEICQDVAEEINNEISECKGSMKNTTIRNVAIRSVMRILDAWQLGFRDRNDILSWLKNEYVLDF